MNPQDADIAQIVSTICQSILGMECQRAMDLPGAAPATLAAWVQITGGWQGAVVLGCTQAFANRAAEIMFGISGVAPSPIETQDAVAELANMIGGNLKGTLPVSDACQLSLPAVVAGADYATRVPGTRLLNRVALDCGGRIIVVHVLEKIATQAAA